MAGRKKLTINDRLDKIDAEIASAEAKLQELKEQKKMLAMEKEQEDLRELRRLILESGKTIDDVKALLS